MNKNKAMKEIKRHIQSFKYIHKKEFLKIDLWHLTFQMDIGLPEIQMTIKFNESFLDVLVFPHPIIVNDNNFYDLLRIINYINWNLKGLGRLYIDDYRDLAYSLRIKYSFFKKMVEFSLGEIEFAIDIYSDLLKTIFDISKGEMSYDDGKRQIDLIWKRV